MEKKTFLTQTLPHIIAVALFLIICVIYFKPQFSGMALRQGDMVQHTGMNRDIVEHRELYGEHPQWAGRAFSGMPSYQIDFKQEGRVIRDAGNALFFLGEPASFIFLAMAAFYLMLLCFGVNPWLGIIGGIAYGLSTYFLVIIEAGHITKMIALAFAPPMIGGIYLAYRRNMWLGAVLTGLFASLEISANHLQITYYFMMIAVALFVNEFIRAYRQKLLSRFAKVTGLLLLAAVLAAGSNATLLWYTYDYSKASNRGQSELVAEDGKVEKGLDIDYATAWSYGKAETFNTYIPNLMGGTSAGGFSSDGPVAQSLAKYGARDIATRLPGYWGDQPGTSGPVYIGAVVMFLFVFAMFSLCGRNKWWIFAVTVLGVFLAWGHNFLWFTELFMNYVPLYNKFRSVSMALVIAEWALPLMAVLALQKVWAEGISSDKFKKAFKYSLIITGGVALFFLLFGGMVFNFAGPNDSRMGLPEDVLAAMRTERLSMLRMDSFRSLIFVLLTAGTLLAFYKGKIKKTVAVVVLAALVLVDLVGVDRRYLNYDTFVPAQASRQISPTQADFAILQDTEPGFRVANFTVNPFSDASTSYFHRSIGGYSAAKMGRYQELVDRYLGNPAQGMPVYNMLNTKYFIVADNEGKPVVQLNEDAFGAAWFVGGVKYVANANEEMDALGATDLRNVAVVDEKFAAELSVFTPVSDSVAVIELTDYKVNHLTYKYILQSEAVAVFSEVYYPKGWTAYIDGVETPHFRADYILRAMKLPAGDHTVEFKFRAPHFTSVAAFSYVCSFLLLGGMLAAVIIYITKRNKKRGDGIER